MSAPKSKRRKTSVSTVTTARDEPEFMGVTRSSTPSRASYQSPTKASLSRSHPEILARSPEKRRSSGQLLPLAFTRERNTDAEPELPPTPTQLGLSPKPGEPRGLSVSSSPTRPKSQRLQSLSRSREISSPHRRGAKDSKSSANGIQRQDSESGAHEEADGNETRESQPELQMEDAVGYPEDSIAKFKVSDDLKAQLENLRSDTARLESVLADQVDEPVLDSADLDLISKASTSTELPISSAVEVRDPVALDVNPLAFLRAFAPADLRLTASTKISRVVGGLHQAHAISVFAPMPWPAHVFNASFTVTCDIEARRIVSLSDAKIQPQNGSGMRELKAWTLGRLRNPLHKVDVGTLIWGLGMWWKEGVTRAQYFHHFSTSRAAKETDTATPYQAKQRIDASDVQYLLPYVGKSFIELLPAEPYSNKASTNEARKYRQPRLLLKWDLEIDWAGEVHSDIGMAGTMMSAKGQEGLKQSFEELMRRNGLDSAVTQILSICRTQDSTGKTMTR